MPHNIIIIGAHSSIGQHITDLLVQHNTKLVLQTRNKTNLKAYVNMKNVAIIESEFSTPEDITTIWDASLNHLKNIDIIINTAAYTDALKNNTYWDQWELAMKVNVIAPAFLAHHASNYFNQHQRYGKLISITSRAAHQGDHLNMMHYAASKAAASNISKTLAKNFTESSLLTYNIAPSYVDTPRIHQTQPHVDDSTWQEQHLPLRQLVSPTEIAQLVWFLIQHPNMHLSGSTFDVNGATYLR